MRLDEDYDNSPGSGLPILAMAIVVSLFILGVLGVVIYINRDTGGGSKKSSNIPTPVASVTDSLRDTDSDRDSLDKLTADDLDIWDMYPEEEEDEEIFDDISPSVTAIPTLSPLSDEERYADGKHFKIELSDGSDEWLTINEKRAKNTYDFTKLVNNDGRLKYEMDGNKTSFIGIDVSRYQADIDFKLVKADGIDFVMIKVGSRGYQTGKLTLDEYFEKNITAAKEAGLDVGVYFSSQAVSIQEAAEEANVVIQALNGRLLEYPVAFDMELVPNDTCRIQNLTKEERSLITATFINTMAAAGYKTICYGNEEWLCKKIDLTNLPSVSVWLSDDDEMPDYPYQYVMWQYSKQGAVKGINGEVNMDICFIDYAAQ